MLRSGWFWLALVCAGLLSVPVGLRPPPGGRPRMVGTVMAAQSGLAAPQPLRVAELWQAPTPLRPDETATGFGTDQLRAPRLAGAPQGAAIDFRKAGQQPMGPTLLQQRTAGNAPLVTAARHIDLCGGTATRVLFRPPHQNAGCQGPPAP